MREEKNRMWIMARKAKGRRRKEREEWREHNRRFVLLYNFVAVVLVGFHDWYRWSVPLRYWRRQVYSGFISGYQGCMWVILDHSAMNENCKFVAVRGL